MRLRTLVVILGVVVGVVVAAQGQTLYGIDARSNLYTVNPTTAAGTLIGSLGISQVAGAEVDPTTGVLYCVPGGGGCCPQPISGCLYTVNKTTGAATQVGCDPVLVGKDPISGIAFTSAGILYAVYYQVNSGAKDGFMHLVTVNKATGAVTEVAATNISWIEGHGIAFSPSGTLFECDSAKLNTINLTTALVSPIASIFQGFPEGLEGYRIPDMSFNMAGVLYAIVTVGTGSGGDTDWLSTVDTSTGTFTYVGTLPAHMHAIAFDDFSAPNIPASTPWGLGVLILLLAVAAAFVLWRGLPS